MIEYPFIVWHRDSFGGVLDKQELRTLAAAQAYVGTVLDVFYAGDKIEIEER